MDLQNQDDTEKTDAMSTSSDIIIGGEYVLGRFISAGGFGSVHYGYSLTNKKVVAIKLELANYETIKKKKNRVYLQNEYNVIKNLINPIDNIKINGIPNVYMFGKKDDYYVLIMDLYGMDIDKLYKRSKELEMYENFKLILPRILYQILVIIEHIHKMGYIHKDIKPQNMVIENGFEPEKIKKKICPKVYLIDYGLTERICNSEGEHVEHKHTGSMSGTVKFMSIDTHLGKQQGRKDDLESFLYIMLYLYNIELPWQNIKEKDKKKRANIIRKLKETNDYEKMCYELPTEILQITNYIRKLNFYTIPDYNYIKKLLYTLDKTYRSKSCL
jgi:serine/threonine protein kinase